MLAKEYGDQVRIIKIGIKILDRIFGKFKRCTKKVLEDDPFYGSFKVGGGFQKLGKDGKYHHVIKNLKSDPAGEYICLACDYQFSKISLIPSCPNCGKHCIAKKE